MSRNMREVSRAQWSTESTAFEAINCGSLMRIADACEVMSKNHAALIADRDNYKRWWDEERQRVVSRDNTIRSMKGVATKLRDRIAELEAQLAGKAEAH